MIFQLDVELGKTPATGIGVRRGRMRACGCDYCGRLNCEERGERREKGESRETEGEEAPRYMGEEREREAAEVKFVSTV